MNIKKPGYVRLPDAGTGSHPSTLSLVIGVLDRNNQTKHCKHMSIVLLLGK